MVMRVSGLASGMDIDSIVKDLMKAERVKVDKLEQNKQIIEWKQEIYNDLSKELANFILNTKKEFGLTTTSSTGVLLNKSVSSLDWVKKATLSNSAIASVEARADAVEGYYEINVQQLAQNWSAASSENISVGNKHNLATQFDLEEESKIDLKIYVNDNEEDPISIQIDDLTSISIFDIVDQINNENKGVKAIYDSSIDRFFIQTEESGSANSIKFVDSSQIIKEDEEGNQETLDFISLLKLQDGQSNDVIAGTKYSGQDAILDFGAAKDITMSSNQFSINGLNFDLKDTGEFTISVSTDIDGVYEKISNFVEEYNELVDKFFEKVEEKRYWDYSPLTDEQKEEMTEEEIELWEEKAKSGLIKNDGIIDDILLSIRSGLYQEVEGVNGIFSQLTQIGISTDSYFNSKSGHLVIDEVELKTAIQEDVDSVLELLFKEPDSDLKYKSESNMTSDEIQAKRNQSGLISRLYDNMVSGIKDIVNKAGPGEDASLYRKVNSSIMIDFIADYSGISLLDKDADYLNDRISTLNNYLYQVENRYWDQFTQMETFINKMNQQSMWLAQQFGTGS